MRIYVASSWRNFLQQGVVHLLRAAGHEVYDFRNPRPGDHGFSWSEIDPDWKMWTPAEFITGLEHELAKEGFDSDYKAMQAAEACVLVLPSGRSAHLEGGWFVGAGKPLYILAPDAEPMEPELMYRMATCVVTAPSDLLGCVGVPAQDDRNTTQ